MPAPIKVTREDILSVSLEITKKEGIDSVNARRLARELNCSIQPVYYYFKTMDQLRVCIIQEARKEYNKYIDASKNDPKYNAFKSVGVNYIKFASKEPNLFKLLYMDNKNYNFEMNIDTDENYPYILKTAMESTGLNEEQAKKLYSMIWVTTHGIACAICTKFISFTENEISEILTKTLKGLMVEIKNDSN